MSIIDLIQNPLVLGMIVFLLVTLFRALKWQQDGLPALWLTMLVALAVGLLDWFVKGGLANIPHCALAWSDPVAILVCVGRIVETVLKEWGVVFGSSQVVYQLLRREIAGRSIMGKRI